MADLVIFDCDGVLIDSEVISARMLIAELAGLGVVVDMAYVASHFLGRSYTTVMATIRQDFGLDLPGSFEDAYRTRLLAAFERELQVMPHVAQALRALSLPLCVATSSSPRRAARSAPATCTARTCGANCASHPNRGRHSARRFVCQTRLPPRLAPHGRRRHGHLEIFNRHRWPCAASRD